MLTHTYKCVWVWLCALVLRCSSSWLWTYSIVEDNLESWVFCLYFWELRLHISPTVPLQPPFLKPDMHDYGKSVKSTVFLLMLLSGGAKPHTAVSCHFSLQEGKPFGFLIPELWASTDGCRHFARWVLSASLGPVHACGESHTSVSAVEISLNCAEAI